MRNHKALWHFLCCCQFLHCFYKVFVCHVFIWLAAGTSWICNIANINWQI